MGLAFDRVATGMLLGCAEPQARLQRGYERRRYEGSVYPMKPERLHESTLEQTAIFACLYLRYITYNAT